MYNKQPSLSGAKRVSVYTKTEGKCAYCGTDLFTGLTKQGGKMPDNKFVVDHIVPISKGGTNDDSNLLPSCRLCNGRKGANDLEEFRFKLAWIETTGVLFTKEQLTWLRDNGFEVPAYEDDYEFYFETL